MMCTPQQKFMKLTHKWPKKNCEQPYFSMNKCHNNMYYLA